MPRKGGIGDKEGHRPTIPVKVEKSENHPPRQDRGTCRKRGREKNGLSERGNRREKKISKESW